MMSAVLDLHISFVSKISSNLLLKSKYKGSKLSKTISGYKSSIAYNAEIPRDKQLEFGNYKTLS